MLGHVHIIIERKIARTMLQRIFIVENLVHFECNRMFIMRLEIYAKFNSKDVNVMLTMKTLKTVLCFQRFQFLQRWWFLWNLHTTSTLLALLIDIRKWVFFSSYLMLSFQSESFPSQPFRHCIRALKCIVCLA